MSKEILNLIPSGFILTRIKHSIKSDMREKQINCSISDVTIIESTPRGDFISIKYVPLGGLEVQECISYYSEIIESRVKQTESRIKKIEKTNSNYKNTLFSQVDQIVSLRDEIRKIQLIS